MEYKRFDNTIFARIDKNEEILEQVKTIALKENIKTDNRNSIKDLFDDFCAFFKQFYLIRC